VTGHRDKSFPVRLWKLIQAGFPSRFFSEVEQVEREPCEFSKFDTLAQPDLARILGGKLVAVLPDFELKYYCARPVRHYP
jgi:hypothetical protein